MIEAAPLTRELPAEFGTLIVVQNERGQRAARGGAACECAGLGGAQGVFADDRSTYGRDAVRAFQREDGQAKPQEKDIRRLSAQQPRIEHKRGIFGTRGQG